MFKPCRQYTYEAKYWDKDLNLISVEPIYVLVTGKAWEPQPELQDEILIQYDSDTTHWHTLQQYSLNPEIAFWVNQTNTGIIETENSVWMHPFRDNQYSFTEVAPFPEVRLPLKKGKIWSGNLSVHEGWGVWSDSELSHVYEVVDSEIITTNFKKLVTWHIYSQSTARFGNSTHNFWYNDDFGFVKMIVENYEGQILQFELTEVVDVAL